MTKVKVKFRNQTGTAFYATLRSRVDAYFTNQVVSKHANPLMVGKTLLFITGYALSYGLLLSGHFSPMQMAWLCANTGLFAAMIGFNVCHDAIHGAYTNNPFVNKLLSQLFHAIGANPFVWNITHNVVHHTYTNISGHDEDIAVAPGLIRLDPHEPYRNVFRYQHLYAFLLYGLSSLSWVLRKDYIKFFKKQIGSYDNSKKPIGEMIALFGFKGLYYVAFLLLPWLVLDVTIGQVLLGFLILHLTEGFIIGLVFQLAHSVEGTDYPEPDEHGTMENAWAIHQLQTTANFAVGNPLVTFLCGGLNMQIEHHLFPKICHVHYAHIAPIVKATAHEFGLPYHENPSVGSALQSHYRMLKKLGHSKPDADKPEEVGLTNRVGQLAGNVCQS